MLTSFYERKRSFFSGNKTTSMHTYHVLILQSFYSSFSSFSWNTSPISWLRLSLFLSPALIKALNEFRAVLTTTICMTTASDAASRVVSLVHSRMKRQWHEDRETRDKFTTESRIWWCERETVPSLLPSFSLPSPSSSFSSSSKKRRMKRMRGEQSHVLERDE